MTTQPSSSSSSSAPAQAPPLENDHLLEEIFRHSLGPQPSSLVRAAAVSRRWERLTTDPGFLRRFHEHHRSTRPLLGVFHNEIHCTSTSVWARVFTPVMDPPNRIPPQRFELRVHDGWVLDCRNGRVLVKDQADWERPVLVVCDPMTGQQHRLPAVLSGANTHFNNGAVLCAAGSNPGHVHGYCNSNPFKVVLLCMSSAHGHASIYSSQTGVWGDVPIADPHDLYEQDAPATLIGNVLHWLCTGYVILRFNLDSQSLSVIQGPPMPNHVQYRGVPCQIMRADNGAIGFAILEYPCLRVWQRNVNGHGIATWVLRSSLKLHDILGVRVTVVGPRHGYGKETIVGYSEDTDTIFIFVDFHVYMLHLKSLEFKRLDAARRYYPFTSFYSPG